MGPPDFEILACEDTPLGMLCLWRRAQLSRPGVTVMEVTLDHALLMSSHVTTSERALATLAIEWHPGTALRVLVGGLGLGYTAQAALASPRVADVEVVEFLPPVIDWMARGLGPLARELAAESRLRVVAGDVFARLAEPGHAEFDVILIDVDHAPDARLAPGNAGFYTPEGLRAVGSHLAAGGVLGVWSAAPNPEFAEAMHAVFPEARVAASPVVNELIGQSYSDVLFLARTADAARA